MQLHRGCLEHCSDLQIQSYEIMRHIDGSINRVQFYLKQGPANEKKVETWFASHLLVDDLERT
jgi:hypothetical protein